MEMDKETRAKLRFEKQRINLQNEQKWRLRKNELEVRHKNRPKDSGTIAELLDLCFKLKDYKRNIIMCNKALQFPELHSVDLFLSLGRSNYNYYMKEKSLLHLKSSIDTYMILFRKKEINRRRDPVHYFEFASMLLRNGQHQQALDVLGTASTLYKDKEMSDWAYVIHHNVAQIMVLRQEYTHALQLYRQLMVIPTEVTVSMDQNLEDHIVYLSTRILSILLSIEMAAVLLKEGKNNKMAFHLLEETWERMKKYGLGKFMQYNRSKLDFHQVDLTCGCSDFKTWVTSPATFKRLGDIVLGEHNLAIASILYGIAAEQILKRGWMNITDDEQDAGISHLLDRGEILAEVGLWDESEEIAHRSHRLTDGCNIVACGRAARCCRPDQPYNQDLLKRARQIVEIVMYVQAKLKVRLIRVRKRLAKKIYDAASRITATFRMELVKNRQVALRLSGLSVKNMNRCLLRLKHVWKSGQQVIASWKELWAISANKIKGCFKAWFSRRTFWKFFRGVQMLKRVFVGQQTRWKVRAAIETVQKFLSSNPTAMERKIYQHTIRKQFGMNINIDVIRRAGAGILCVSADNEMQQIVVDSSFNPDFNSVDMNMMPLHPKKNRVNFKSNDFVAEQSVARPKDHPTFVEGAHKPGANVKDGQNWFVQTEPITTSINSVNMRSPKKKLSPVKRAGGGKDSKEYAKDTRDSKSQLSVDRKKLDKLPSSSSNSNSNSNSNNIDSNYRGNNITPSITSSVPDMEEGSASSTSVESKPGLASRTRSLSKNMIGTLGKLNNTALFRSASSGDVSSMKAAVEAERERKKEEEVVMLALENGSSSNPDSAAADKKPSFSGKYKRQVKFGPDTYEDYESQRSKDFVASDMKQKNRSYVYSTSTNSYYFAEKDEFDIFPEKKSTLVDPSEEFFSIFNIVNVSRDMFTRWIPFGLTPTKELARVLNCTALCIASASFKCADAMRLSRILRGGLLEEGDVKSERTEKVSKGNSLTTSTNIASSGSTKGGGGRGNGISKEDSKQDKEDESRDLSILSRPPPDDCLWRKVRSLEVYGTAMGQSGMACLLNLGIQQLTSISISSTNMTHWSGQILGRQCISQLNGVNMHCSLRKIFIENEPKFADRGFGYLLKYLQHNSSVEHLTVRNCNITKYCLNPLHRYISVSSALKYFNISDNKLGHKEIDSILVAVANKGSRGVLRQITIRHQSPPITLEKACALYQRAVQLGVRLTADIIPPRLEMAQEMLGKIDQDELWVANISKVVQEMIEFGEKADTTQMSFLKFVVI